MEGKWQVLSQEQVLAKLVDGSIGSVIRVTFQTALGVVGKVDVPAATYNVDTAKAAIAERAQHLDEVQAL